MAQKRKKFSIVLIAVVALLIGFLGGYLAGFRYGIRVTNENISPIMSKQFQEKPLRGDFGSMSIEIVRELNCICGCKMELLPCTCEEARGSKEIKQFVQKLVDEGLSKTEVISQLVERYGKAILREKIS